MISAPDHLRQASAPAENVSAARVTVGSWTEQNILRAELQMPYVDTPQFIVSLMTLRSQLERLFERPAGQVHLATMLTPEYIELSCSATVRSALMPDFTPGSPSSYVQTLVLRLPRDRAVYTRATRWLFGDGAQEGFFTLSSREPLELLENKWEAATVAERHGGAQEGRHFRNDAGTSVVGASVVSPLVKHWGDLFRREQVEAVRRTPTIATGEVYTALKNRVGQLLRLSGEATRAFLEPKEVVHNSPRPTPTTREEERSQGAPVVEMYRVDGTISETPAREEAMEETSAPQGVHEEPIVPEEEPKTPSPRWFAEMEEVYRHVGQGLETGAPVATFATASSRNWVRYLARLSRSIVQAKTLSREFWAHERTVFLERLAKLGSLTSAMKKMALERFWIPLCRTFVQARKQVPTRQAITSFFARLLESFSLKPSRVAPLEEPGQSAQERFTRAALAVRGEDTEKPMRFMMVNGQLVYTDPKEQAEHMALMAARARVEDGTRVVLPSRPPRRPRRPEPVGFWDRAREFAERWNPFAR